ncbi:hypothetical protein K501DRAFT_330447 [Backusella circina FSU 941]|nr:hypothetical protein K501DRAFT_330447 [Backusella circina FSU 941]
MSSATTKSKGKRRCPVCHTTKIKRSDDYGLVCKYGHKILGIQKEEEDEVTIGPRIARKRKRKIIDKEIITASVRKSTFIRILQYALKVICRKMVQDLGFPPELEHTVRELWLVSVSALNIELDNSYIFEMKEKERNESKGTQNTSNEENPEQLLSDQEEDDDETDDGEENTLKDTMKLNYDDDDDDDNKKTRRPPKSIHTFQLHYEDTLALIYLACIYLRLPVLLGDLVRWCKDETLPYTSLQSRLPEELFKFIPLQVANSMAFIPDVGHLQQRAMDLAKYVLLSQGLLMPEYNIPLYLDRFCSQFYLPVEAYYLSLYLFKKYQLPCHLTISKEDKVHHTVLKKLMACVVCVIKMMYSLDHSTDFQDNSSVYDINTTRGEWIDLLKKNITSWEQCMRVNPEDDTPMALRLIKDSSRAHEIATPFKVKRDLLRNFLNQKVPTTITEKQKGNDNPFINPPEKTMPTKDDGNVQPEGRFYYMYKFGLRPCDYELVMKLACLVVGEGSMMGLEYLISMVDKNLSSTKRIENFNVDIVSHRYPLYDVALENLYGTKFFPNSFL